MELESLPVNYLKAAIFLASLVCLFYVIKRKNKDAYEHGFMDGVDCAMEILKPKAPLRHNPEIHLDTIHVDSGLGRYRI